MGPVCASAFNTHGITSVFQLIGKYLTFIGADSTPKSVAQAYFDWLGTVGLPHSGASKHAITRAIAERINAMLPGTYDVNAYGGQQQG